jgi:MFS transporter, DHA2 family, metal-tetracycline-proton antiporter
MPLISVPTAKTNSRLPLEENKIIWIWGLTTWLVVMNTTMFNVALPSVLSELSLNSQAAAWVVSGYSVMFAISTLTFSRLSDFIPITRLLIVGLSIYLVGTVFGFFSHQFYALLVARIVQALGGGVIPGLGMVVAGRYIPLSRRGKAMAIIASGASLGFGLGPVIGGIITQYLGWNYLFLVTSLIVVFIPFIGKLLPKEVIQQGQFDSLGAALTGLSVTGVLLFLSTFSYSILFVTIFLCFVWWKYLHKKNEPFIQPEILVNRQFVKILSCGFIVFLFNFANLFLMPIILTNVFNKEPFEVGMIIFPGAIIAVFASQIIGRLIDLYGTPPGLYFSLTCLTVASMAFALLSTRSPYFILAIYIFASIGFAAFNASTANEVTRILAREEIGAAMGILQLAQFVGGAMGVTLAGLLISLQDGFSAEMMYRNIYLILFMLISLSGMIQLSYFKKSKMLCEEQEQT